MKPYIKENWNKVLQAYFETMEFAKLWDFIKNEYQHTNIYPLEKDIFKSFNLTPLEKISIVIIGQDPYHQPHQAHGLSFSVPHGITIPPSLKNIFKEIESDTGIKKDFTDGNLESWSHQGILLLNSVLTVQENKPSSHANIGWEEFTNFVIKQISDQKEHVIFFLWGNYAQKKGSLIDRSRHLVLETSHPSPLGAYRGFIGCRHFSRANEYLKKHNKSEINW
jgi:uracil-DNA glycosylase